MSEYLGIGLMSGSSLDGVDLALVRFQENGGCCRYEILKAETIPYPPTWKERLSNAFLADGDTLKQLDLDYGDYLGRCVEAFVNDCPVTPDFIASHGHTVFHKPEQHYTLQIGNGQALADRCHLLTINDFRSEDVGKGGQGAPLVPIGDQLLFNEYALCLNIGGIANISYEWEGKRIAFDICMANQALNYLAQREGLDYDVDGNLARHGSLNPALLQALDDHPFFAKQPPKSLGREFFESYQKHLLTEVPTSDALATFTEHIARQIARAIEPCPNGSMLVTGGGAHNAFLVERIQQHTQHHVVVPDALTVDYKEALIFALLGMLRLEGRVNVLCSVTGACSDSCSGLIWHPKRDFTK